MVPRGERSLRYGCHALVRAVGTCRAGSARTLQRATSRRQEGAHRARVLVCVLCAWDVIAGTCRAVAARQAGHAVSSRCLSIAVFAGTAALAGGLSCCVLVEAFLAGDECAITRALVAPFTQASTHSGATCALGAIVSCATRRDAGRAGRQARDRVVGVARARICADIVPVTGRQVSEEDWRIG